jgi:hypothetical protein
VEHVNAVDVRPGQFVVLEVLRVYRPFGSQSSAVEFKVSSPDEPIGGWHGTVVLPVDEPVSVWKG